MSQFQEILEEGKYFKELRPEHLATELRNYVEAIDADGSVESRWELFCIARASALLSGRVGVVVEERPADAGTLLPCPFCGESPEYREAVEHAPGEVAPEYVMCRACHIVTRTGFNGVKNAVTAWNTRKGGAQ